MAGCVFTLFPCEGAVEGSTFSVGVRVTSRVNVLCVFVCGSGIHAQLCYRLSLQMEKWQLCLSDWARAQVPSALRWAPAGAPNIP